MSFIRTTLFRFFAYCGDVCVWFKWGIKSNLCAYKNYRFTPALTDLKGFRTVKIRSVFNICAIKKLATAFWKTTSPCAKATDSTQPWAKAEYDCQRCIYKQRSLAIQSSFFQTWCWSVHPRTTKFNMQDYGKSARLASLPQTGDWRRDWAVDTDTSGAPHL